MSSSSASASAADTSLSVVSAASLQQCYKCGGGGQKVVFKAPRGAAGTAALAPAPASAAPHALPALPLTYPHSIPCPACAGRGTVLPKAPRKRAASSRVESLFPAWIAPGPVPPVSAALDPDLLPSLDEELSCLTGAWRIFQTLAGHRYSTDDVVTAWVAWRVAAAIRAAVAPPAAAAPAAAAALRYADIGCGIGSVALMTAWLDASASVTGLEAQPARAAQARRSARFNGCDDRVAIRDGDLRDAAVLATLGAAAFDVVTGTPPYFNPAGARPASEDSARCLFESRGGIEAYCAAAASLIARPHGAFVVVETALEVHRTYAAAAASGLRVVGRLDVVPAVGKPPLICVFVMVAAGAGEAPPAGVAWTPALFEPRGYSPYEEGGGGGGGAAVDPAVAPEAERGGASAGAGADATPAPDAAAAPASSTAPPPARKKQRTQPLKPFPGAVADEVVSTILVREADGRRSDDYVRLLRDLGKPG